MGCAGRLVGRLRTLEAMGGGIAHLARRILDIRSRGMAFPLYRGAGAVRRSRSRWVELPWPARSPFEAVAVWRKFACAAYNFRRSRWGGRWRGRLPPWKSGAALFLCSPLLVY
jgi:hypothetical protein